jgi:hypothetical protein
MADRRSTERLLVDLESIDFLTPDPLRPAPVEKHAERLIVPAESLDRVCMEDERRETQDRTEPIRLSFLALLAEKDPHVQARLHLRRTTAVEPTSEDDRSEDERPTDPMVRILSSR